MALNFKICSRQNNGDVMMELSGEFDGSSACELINILKTCCGKGGRVYIDTSSLSRIHPFGVRVFQKDCVIHNLSRHLVFIGVNGNILAGGSSPAG